ncbi:kinase-like domain-protein [Podospora aff. communis PSN243]|uniref:Kinase-like domain-protein n=1 Tax=Podospora aff. communis PSN243 TaxID=3040156 RepID=A0AAV9GE31_9PEZI|nr:kinase-like domain-protein [Podospora aff. communis PSN243]
MTSLTQIPISLPDDKTPTKANIRDIMAIFFPAEWASVDPETLITSYNKTFANSHCVVRRPTPNNDITTEPLKFARSGWGAKVYGLFQTQDGTVRRVDEFVDTRTLLPEDVEDAGIRGDVTRALAAFHSLGVPLEKEEVDRFHKTLIEGLKRFQGSEKLKSLGRNAGVDIEEMVNYDLASKVGQVCIHDVQYINVLVRNNPSPGDSKVVLIDFEFAMWNCRAFDLGGHFMQKMFKWYDEESKVANCRRYTGEEKRHFCEEYAEKWNKWTGDLDTGEQVLAESELGYLLAVGFDVHNMLCAMDEEGDGDPLSLVGLKKLFEEFLGQHKEVWG